MKKFLVLFAMVAFVGTIASAQAPAKCTKSKAACTASKTSAKTVSTDAEALPTCSVAAAAKLASLDESIQSKTCSASGTVSYYKKNVCSTSGKVSLKEVKYCSTSQAFVNVAPPANKEAQILQAADTKKKASCSKTCTKSKSSCSKSKTAETGTATQVKLENK